MAQLIRIYFHGLFLSRVRSITQTYGVSQIWDRRETGSHHSAAARAGYEAARPGFLKKKRTPPNSLPSPPNPSVVFPRASSCVQPPGVAHEAGLCAELSHGALSRSMHAGAVHTHRSTHNTHTNTIAAVAAILQASCMAPAVKATILKGGGEKGKRPWRFGAPAAAVAAEAAAGSGGEKPGPEQQKTGSTFKSMQAFHPPQHQHHHHPPHHQASVKCSEGRGGKKSRMQTF